MSQPSKVVPAPLSLPSSIKNDDDDSHTSTNNHHMTVTSASNSTATNSASRHHGVSSTSSSSLSSTSTAKAAEAERPKRSRSAYNYFFRSERAKLLGITIEELESLEEQKTKRRHRKTPGMMGFAELASYMGDKWRKLSDSEKEPYQRSCQEDRERYNREMSIWQAKYGKEQGNDSNKSKTSSSSASAADMTSQANNKKERAKTATSMKKKNKTRSRSSSEPDSSSSSSSSSAAVLKHIDEDVDGDLKRKSQDENVAAAVSSCSSAISTTVPAAAEAVDSSNNIKRRRYDDTGTDVDAMEQVLRQISTGSVNSTTGATSTIPMGMGIVNPATVAAAARMMNGTSTAINPFFGTGMTSTTQLHLQLQQMILRQEYQKQQELEHIRRLAEALSNAKTPERSTPANMNDPSTADAMMMRSALLASLASSSSSAPSGAFNLAPASAVPSLYGLNPMILQDLSNPLTHINSSSVPGPAAPQLQRLFNNFFNHSK